MGIQTESHNGLRDCAVEMELVRKAILLATVVSAISLGSTAKAVDLGGVLKTKSAYNTLEHDWYQHDAQLDIELGASLVRGEITAITRLLLDSEGHLNHNEQPESYSELHEFGQAKQHATASLRELYWSYQSDSVFWRLGKQQVVWGEADGLKLLDLVNPQDYREFILDDFEDSRIPIWMINAEMNIGDDSVLQVLWIPDTTNHSLATRGSPYTFTSPLLVPQPLPGVTATLEEHRASRKLLKDSDAGLRFSHYWSGWDLTFNYLYHTVDEPVLRTQLDNGDIVVTSDYERSHLIGGSASNAFGSWTLRTEVAYEMDRYHRSTETMPGVIQANQWGSVIGLDYQGWSDQLISFQWFQTKILIDDNVLIKSKTEETVSLLWEMKFMNETLSLSWLNLYSLDHHDGLMRPKVRYNLYSNLDVELGLDRFYGNNKGVFGQFDQTDRVHIGLEWGFDLN